MLQHDIQSSIHRNPFFIHSLKTVIHLYIVIIHNTFFIIHNTKPKNIKANLTNPNTITLNLTQKSIRHSHFSPHLQGKLRNLNAISWNNNDLQSDNTTLQQYSINKQ